MAIFPLGLGLDGGRHGDEATTVVRSGPGLRCAETRRGVATSTDTYSETELGLAPLSVCG